MRIMAIDEDKNMMKDGGVSSFADSTPCVMLNVEQFRHVIRQEILSALKTKAELHSRNLIWDQDNELSKKQYLSVKEAAQVLGLGVSTIRLYIRKGTLVPQRVGKRIIIKRADLEHFPKH